MSSANAFNLDWFKFLARLNDQCKNEAFYTIFKERVLLLPSSI